MNDHSFEGQGLHSEAAATEIRRAGENDVPALADYLRSREASSALAASDLSSLLRADHTAVFFAALDGAIAGVAACASEGATMRLLHFVSDAPPNDSVSALAAAIEDHAKRHGASLLFSQAPRGSAMHGVLLGLGYVEDFAETEVIGGRAVAVVDLLKILP